MNPSLTYAFIFFAQTIQLTLITYKTILTARNERKLNTALTLFQEGLGMVSNGLTILGSGVLIYRIISFVCGCSLGCLFGMLLDEALAIGTNMVTVIVNKSESQRIANDIRERGFALTTVDAKSNSTNKTILMIALKRKKERKLINTLLKNEKDVVMIDESVSTYGGYY